MTAVRYTREDLFNSPWKRITAHDEFLVALGEFVLISARFEYRLTELVIELDCFVDHDRTSPPGDVVGKLKFVKQQIAKLNWTRLTDLWCNTEGQLEYARELRNHVGHGLTTVVPVSPEAVVFSSEKFQRSNQHYDKLLQKIPTEKLIEFANAYHQAENIASQILAELKSNE